MLILMDILSQSVALHEKLLVFRYSIFTFVSSHVSRLSGVTVW